MKIEVIAEIGVNHGGRIEEAMRLVDFSVTAGADIIKLQVFRPEEVPDEHKSLALNSMELITVANKIKRAGRRLATTAFTKAGVEFCRDWLKPNYMKVASPDLSNRFLLQEVAHTGIPTLLSSGGHTISETLDRVRGFLLYPKSRFVAVLACTSKYPTSPEAFDFNKITQLKREFNTGFSGHTPVPKLFVWAAAAGARWIEAHIKSLESSGPDLTSSLFHEDFSEMVNDIRLLEKIFDPKNLEGELKPNAV